MSDNAAAAWIEQARSRSQVAKSTHEEPAKQETKRALIFCGTIVAVLALGHFFTLTESIVIAGLSAVTARFGIPAAIEKWRHPTVPEKKTPEILPPMGDK